MSETSVCTVLDAKNRKFICYTRRKNGVFSVCLTDAADVWSADFTEEEEQNQLTQKFSLNSSEDFILKLRSSCSRGDASVSVHDAGAELRAGSGPGDPSAALRRLEGPRAAEELRELLFRMADGLTQPDGGPPSVSPVKAHLRRVAEFEPRRRQDGAPSVTVKRRLPGASLINPGTKKMLQATGVAFDDVDER
ncbi:protein PAXX [Embiotoca jacksoni]|uniref:protein PAXX n=1 Tax=Embiotoca jacksoni TaxID=100190 RepID=UPI00370404C1